MFFTFHISMLLNMFITSVYYICSAKRDQNSRARRNFEDDHSPWREAGLLLSQSQPLVESG